MSVNGGEKPDERAEQKTATVAFGVRSSEGVGMRPGAVSAGNEGSAPAGLGLLPAQQMTVLDCRCPQGRVSASGR